MTLTRLLSATGLVLALAAGAAHAQTWKAYSYSPKRGIPAADTLYEIGDRVAKATGGALKITVFLGGSLPISTSDMGQTVGRNIVQLGIDSQLTGNVPVAGVLRLPMLVTTREEYAKASAIIGPLVRQRYAELGIEVLGEFVYPAVTVWGASRPIAALGDIAGAKLRVNTPELSDFVSAFGGMPVTLNSVDLAPALQRGVVEGMTSAAAGGGQIVGEFLSTNYRIPLYVPAVYYIANRAAFEGLAPEVQAALRDAVARAGEGATAFNDREEDKVLAALRDKGLKVTHPVPGDVAEAARRLAPMWIAWAKSKGPDVEAALEKVRLALGK